MKRIFPLELPVSNVHPLNQQDLISKTHNESMSRLHTKTVLSISIHLANQNWDELTNQIIYQGED